jgi:hypothetical protein
MIVLTTGRAQGPVTAELVRQRAHSRLPRFRVSDNGGVLHAREDLRPLGEDVVVLAGLVQILAEP